jgi:hypothetical protein
MIFKPKFFLDLSGDSSDKPAAPAKVGPIREAKPAAKDAKASAAPVVAGPAPKAAAAAAPSATPSATPGAAPAAVSEGAAPAPAQVSGGLTTVEAIAAELAAAQANRPAPSLATFAAECLVPGGSTTPRRRRGGANLADFRAIARSFTKN